MSTLFIGFVVLMAAVVVALARRYAGQRATRGVLILLVVWFAYVGLMGYFGVLANASMRPPGVAFVLIPVVGFLVFVVLRLRSGFGERIAVALPVWIVVGTQVFRVGVELFLHELWAAGLVPRMLTFAGANVDIYIGASAPLVAWLSGRGRTGLKAALVWNVLGLLALANVVSRAVLTAPGPLNRIHAEVPNRMFGAFPFMFIPAFFVPLAVTLHSIAIRSITRRLRVDVARSGVDE